MINNFSIENFLDLSKSYKDEELFEIIGIKYNKSEINKILNK